ncbi:hypothetical protein B0H16DRAFT_275653 [Mycena metata]|uniref:Uncharacterized protein n=1 Tax=Mycena metata TaxID=1033252 RepID=A0AAD7MPZ5_9AGAR|nr:hypothetical protein B0H16DRAFT_275653 [Mycena metata]
MYLYRCPCIFLRILAAIIYYTWFRYDDDHYVRWPTASSQSVPLYLLQPHLILIPFTCRYINFAPFRVHVDIIHVVTVFSFLLCYGMNR